MIRNLSLYMCLCLMPMLGSAEENLANANIVSWSKGTLEYRSISTGEVSGSEEFRFTVHPDNSRTVQTTNRLDNLGVRRDVLIRVNKDYRPQEVFASYWAQGEWRGTGLFTLRGTTMNARIHMPMGTIDQTIEVPESFSFVPHPLTINAFHHWIYDHEKGGKQTITYYDMPSRAKPTGSLIGTLNESTIEYKGRRKVETEAGTFETDYYLFGEDFDMYVTPDHSLLIRAVWHGADAEYVLVALEEGS